MRTARAVAGHLFTALVAVTCLAVASPVRAQSQVEMGEKAWFAGHAFARQGNADSALAAFARARTIAVAEHDSDLTAAALRGSAEVMRVYRGCTDSALALLRNAAAVSIVGDRAASLSLVRLLADLGQAAEARRVHTVAFADVAGEVPRTITRESIGYLTGLAAVQRASGQGAAALASLSSARDIAARLKSGDAPDSVAPRSPYAVDYVNYWVMYDLAQLRLTSKARGVMSVAEGKALMDAVARASDEPDEGDRRRFPVFRLADRLRIKEWNCQMSGDRCPAPQPKACVK